MWEHFRNLRTGHKLISFLGYMYKHTMSSSFLKNVIGISARPSRGWEIMSIMTHQHFKYKDISSVAIACSLSNILPLSYFSRCGIEWAISYLLGNDWYVNARGEAMECWGRGRAASSSQLETTLAGSTARVVPVLKDAAVHYKTFAHGVTLTHAIGLPSSPWRKWCKAEREGSAYNPSHGSSK